MGKLIDADALKDWLEIVPLTDDGGVDINDLESWIAQQPTANAWIPCSERMPETEEYVLCTTETKKGLRQVVKGYYMHDVKDWACGMNRNVLAWMPMPERYRGDESAE